MQKNKLIAHGISLALFIGTLVSGYSVTANFARFYGYEGTLFKIYNCIERNPVTTPCFYGALAFLGTLIWSLLMLKMPADKETKHRKYQMNLLIGATIFAWSNFGLELFRFLTRGNGSVLGCSGHPISNPFITACFAGSVLFLLALILTIILKKNNLLPAPTADKPII